MGYAIIKPNRGGAKQEECFNVSGGRIYFSRPLYLRLGLLGRPQSAVILVDKETGALCFDFKDRGQMPDSHRVCVHLNKNKATTVCIYCKWAVAHYGIPFGKYRIVDRDGSVWKSDCIIPSFTD